MSFAHGPTAEANRRRKATTLAATATDLGLDHVAERHRVEVLRRTAGVARASDLTWRLVDQLLAEQEDATGEPDYDEST